MEDARIIQAVKDGDHQAFGDLVARYQRLLVVSARHLTQSQDEAEDMAQEAFIEAYRSLPSLHDPEKFKPWLFTILRRRCHNTHRRQRPHTVSLEAYEDSLAAPSTPDTELMSLLDMLPMQDREVLIARYLYDLQFDEIASALRITPDAARMRCNRALQRLRRLCHEDTDERMASRLALAWLTIPSPQDFTSQVLQEVLTMTSITHATALPTLAGAKSLGGLFAGITGKAVLGTVLLLGILGTSVAMIPTSTPPPTDGPVAASATTTDDDEWSEMVDREPARWIFSGPSGGSCGVPDSDLRFELIGPGRIEILQLKDNGRFRVKGCVRVLQTGQVCNNGWIAKDGKVTSTEPTPTNPQTADPYWPLLIDGEPAILLCNIEGGSWGCFGSDLRFEYAGPGEMEMYELKNSGRFLVVGHVRVVKTGAQCSNGWMDNHGNVLANDISIPEITSAPSGKKTWSSPAITAKSSDPDWPLLIDGEPSILLCNMQGGSWGCLGSKLRFAYVGPGAMEMYQLKNSGRFRVFGRIRVVQTGQLCADGWIDKDGTVLSTE